MLYCYANHCSRLMIHYPCTYQQSISTSLGDAGSKPTNTRVIPCMLLWLNLSRRFGLVSQGTLWPVCGGWKHIVLVVFQISIILSLRMTSNYLNRWISYTSEWTKYSALIMHVDVISGGVGEVYTPDTSSCHKQSWVLIKLTIIHWAFLIQHDRISSPKLNFVCHISLYFPYMSRNDWK